MSIARSISTRLMRKPLKLRPRISRVCCAARSGLSASLISPALPRPPACTGALTATRPISRAAAAALLAGDLAGNGDELPEQRLVLRPRLRDRRDVLARDHQHVHRRLRVEVSKGDRLLIAVHDVGRDLAGGDAAEDALRQCRPPD